MLSSSSFRVETRACGMLPQQRRALRLEHAVRVLDEIRQWFDVGPTTLAPMSRMGKAIAHTFGNRVACTRYLEDGRTEDIIDNGAERALRRVANGRRNWVFIGDEAAGPSAAVPMGILQAWCEQGVNAVERLRDAPVRAVVSVPESLAGGIPNPPRGSANRDVRHRTAARDSGCRVVFDSGHSPDRRAIEVASARSAQAASDSISSACRATPKQAIARSGGVQHPIPTIDSSGLVRPGRRDQIGATHRLLPSESALAEVRHRHPCISASTR